MISILVILAALAFCVAAALWSCCVMSGRVSDMEEDEYARNRIRERKNGKVR